MYAPLNRNVFWIYGALQLKVVIKNYYYWCAGAVWSHWSPEASEAAEGRSGRGGVCGQTGRGHCHAEVPPERTRRSVSVSPAVRSQTIYFCFLWSI